MRFLIKSQKHENIGFGEIIFTTRKRFLEKKHSCGFVFQNQPIYMPIFLIQNTYIIDHIRSHKRDNIYKLCLRMQEEHNC